MAMKIFGRMEMTATAFPQGSLLVCDTVDDLPVTGLHVGDKALILSTGAKKYCYNGTSWTDEGGGGPHTHPESDVVDLLTHLSGKAASDHTHSIYAALSHAHAQADVTDLVTALASKADASALSSHTGAAAPHSGHMATSAFSGLAKISVGTGQPSNPTAGDLWCDTN
jgi:hypothetical protein